jgi:L-fuconolactonase
MIDSHQHFWNPGRGDYDWLAPGSTLHRAFQPEDLRPLLLESGIEGSILVQAAATAAETDYLLTLARANPWVLGVIGWVDLAAGDAPAQVRTRAREPGFVGVRPMLQDMPDRTWIVSEAPRAGLQAVQAAGLAFDALVRWPQLPSVITLAERHPELRVILDHAGKPPFGDDSAWSFWQGQIRALARLPNVACKLSGLLTECPERCGHGAVDRCVELLLDLFGPERLLWGSDWPVATTVVRYADWLSYCRSSVERHAATYAAAIFGGNARRIYKLDFC